jgi:hypothetical protein
MAQFRGNFRRCLAVGVAIVSALGAVFGIALMVSAVNGSGTPSSILLGGFGFIITLLSALALVYAVRLWTAGKTGQNI